MIRPQNERNTISVADLRMRTTSSVEGINSVIQRHFPQKPDIFHFVENLKMHESIKSSDLHRLFLKKRQVRKRKEDEEREERIQICSEHLKNGEISAMQFLKLLANQKAFSSFRTYYF